MSIIEDIVVFFKANLLIEDKLVVDNQGVSVALLVQTLCAILARVWEGVRHPRFVSEAALSAVAHLAA